VSQLKPTPILPRGAASERPLLVIMIVMSFLASLILIVSLMGLRQSMSWQNDLDSTATLQVLSDNLDTQDQQARRAADILRNTAGVKTAERLSKSENRKLLNPWIGELSLPEDIALPSLIRIEADYDALDTVELNQKLSAAGIDAKLDNHQQWSQNLATTWRRLRFALLSLLTMVLIATICISSFATQSVLRSRQNIINVLGQVGATDSFISRLFFKRFLSLGFKAAITGMVLSVLFVSIFMVWQNLGTDETGLKLAIEFFDIVWLIALAILLGAISAITAHISARKSIRSQRPTQ